MDRRASAVGSGRYAAAAVAAVLVADAVLVRTKRETFTGWHRRTVSSTRGRRWLAVGELYLLAHLWGEPRVLGPLDPLNVLGRLVAGQAKPPTL